MLYFRKATQGESKGFITHADRDVFEVFGYGRVWVTEVNSDALAWAVRNSLEEITKDAAQVILDQACDAAMIQWDKRIKEDPLDVRPERETIR